MVEIHGNESPMLLLSIGFTRSLTRKDMIITNKHGLPAPFVDAMTMDNYSRGESDYTTTELIGPPRIRVLMKRHYDEIEMDVMERVWSMSGSVRHHIFEMLARKRPERYIAEMRFYLDVGGKKVGGQIDLYDRHDRTLYDWKEVKVWKVQSNDFTEWEAQANINSLLCNNAGVYPERLVNIAIMKDWSKSKVRFTKGYPKEPAKAITLRYWPWAETMEYLESRLAVHDAARDAKEPPLCSPKERWQDPPKWAAKKKGLKRALKLYDTEAEAKAHKSTDGKPIEVEFRPSTPKRCIDYCPVKTFCSFGRQALKEFNETQQEEES